MQGTGTPPALWGCRAATCMSSNVVVENGTLTMWSRNDASVPAPYNYSSGALTTQGKKTWTWTEGPYRVCISAILPGYEAGNPAAGTGYWPAHWLMPDDTPGPSTPPLAGRRGTSMHAPVQDARGPCDPDEGEFDILEMVDGNGKGYATYHWQDNWPAQNCTFPTGHKEVTNNTMLPADWGTTFHEYAVEVKGGPQGHVAFVYDGVTLLNSSVAGSGTSPGNPYLALWPMPFYLWLNTAIGAEKNWPGAPNASTVFPSAHVIDYVRVVQAPSLL